MALDKISVAQLYQKRAGNYDISANLYYLIGIREFAYRKNAADALKLERGDTVIEIGCGTGLNFQLLRERVGSEGKIIGVDLTVEMLSAASKRIERHNWSNIELVQSDAAAYDFPDRTDGIISTFAITLIPEYEKIIKKGATALSPGKRLVVLDFKMPDSWPMWLIKFFVIITRPFGVTLDLANRHPWESIDQCLNLVEFNTKYFGGIYIAAGQKR
ncbi:MAG: class I SAM-dependent methyltransferase [Desulfobacterales bacterium]|jgi:demethylmenaquinone methyltransferase/2-methoxy-6-polyprenyl-1,4-benzoquinol methylase